MWFCQCLLAALKQTPRRTSVKPRQKCSGSCSN